MPDRDVPVRLNLDQLNHQARNCDPCMHARSVGGCQDSDAQVAASAPFKESSTFLRCILLFEGRRETYHDN